MHLVKPILKLLGFAFESKPMFFEEHIKGPDFALFRSEEERVASSSQWGTDRITENLLGLLLVKRYGRNLEEGISGFLPRFREPHPFISGYVSDQNIGRALGILTNGKNWLLLKKPLAFEKPLLEINLEHYVTSNDERGMLSFYHIFSSTGLGSTLPELIEKERIELIRLLKEERSSLSRTLNPPLTETEVRAATIPLYGRLFPDNLLSGEENGAQEAGPITPFRRPGKATVAKGVDQSDVFTYLLSKGTDA